MNEKQRIRVIIGHKKLKLMSFILNWDINHLFKHIIFIKIILQFIILERIRLFPYWALQWNVIRARQILLIIVQWDVKAARLLHFFYFVQTLFTLLNMAHFIFLKAFHHFHIHLLKFYRRSYNILIVEALVFLR